MPRAYPVTDIHIHIQPWGMLRPEILAMMRAKRQDLEILQQALADPKALLALMDREGIERAGLINYAAPEVMGFTDEVNEFVVTYAAAAPDRLIPFGSVHPKYSTDVRGDLMRWADRGLRGIKIHPPHMLFDPDAYLHDLPQLADLYAACSERSVPVMVHTGTSIFHGARNKHGDPIRLDDVAVDFPKLKLILAHAGRPLWGETAIFLARRHPNVHLDVSSIPPQKLLEYVPPLEALSHKILWGTDWPAPMVPGMGENLRRFLELPLEEEARRRILHGNAEKLFPPGR